MMTNSLNGTSLILFFNVPYQILMRKMTWAAGEDVALTCSGLLNKIVKWVMQTEQVTDLAELGSVSRVPQGSVLGSLKFFISVNETPDIG